MRRRSRHLHPAAGVRHSLALLLVGIAVLAGGCALSRPATPRSTGASRVVQPDASSQSSEQIITEWLLNRNIAEWILARVAGACWDVSQRTESAQARFEILELRANFGSSCMSLMNGITPRSQIVGMTILTEMVHRVWVTEGRLNALSGSEADPLEQALADVRKRLLIECRRYCTEEEVQRLGKGVETWRAAHPGKIDATFLRFDVTTDEIAKTLGNVGDDPKGLFGALDGRLYNAILLGERLMFQISRMPRLLEWHAEAALAATLAQQEVQDAAHSLKSFERLEPVLTSESDRVQSTLNSLPERLTASLVQQPEVVGLLKSSRDLEARLGQLEDTVETFDKTVAQLSDRLGGPRRGRRA
ncbi:MAG: hypothetical protein ACO3I0_00740 [Limisphaerales bacterium]